MPQITIPKRSFRTAVRGYTRESWDMGVNACLFRELIQNSLDAGASRIDFTLTETSEAWVLTCRDNGRGMSKETLIAAMLTYSGSVKASGAVGGFGMAKNMICFATNATEIRTGDVGVRVEGIDYEFFPVETPVVGCEFTLHCDKLESELALRLQPSKAGLEYFMSRSCVSAVVTFNGERVYPRNFPLEPERVAKEFGWGAKGYHFPRHKPVERNGVKMIPVCMRGMWMFDMVCPASVKTGAVVIDIDRDSVAVLTDTRCSLSNYDHRDSVEQWVASLARDAKHALRTKKYSKRFRGRGVFFANPVATLTPAAVAGTAANVAEALVTAGVPVHDAAAIVSRIPSFGNGTVVLNQLKTLLSTQEWENDLMIDNDLEQTVPAKFLPETMSPGAKKLLTVWVELVRQFMVWQGGGKAFGVGFIFSDDAGALHKKEDGIDWFLINPMDKFGKLRFRLTGTKHRDRVVTLAAHEVAHASCDSDGHDSDFAASYDVCVQHALTGVKTLHKIWRTARPKN